MSGLFGFGGSSTKLSISLNPSSSGATKEVRAVGNGSKGNNDGEAKEVSIFEVRVKRSGMLHREVEMNKTFLYCIAAYFCVR